MHLLDDVRTQLNDIVHWDTQQAERGADLTVGSVYRLTEPGQLDFGGSEFAPAGREQIRPQKAAPDDDYGWWKLSAGTYAIQYNESLALDDGHIARLFPLERLLQAGAHHPAVSISGSRDPIEMLLTVGSAGCHLKENCRVSRLAVFSIP